MATPDDFDSAAPAVADPVTTDDADRALYRRGVLLVLCSALTLSLNGLIFRLIDDATAWQVLFYRSAALAVAMTCLFALRHRHRTVAEFRRAGRSALLAGPVLGVAGVCFIQALDHTTVANTLFTASSVPLFAAVIAWVFLGERVGRATWIAIGVALCGIGV
ncbi:MAG: DMT family transporter, partial [Alphaproteobacteria bacterium]